MTLLRKTQPYFVRCIKPNHEQIPNHLIDHFVLKQLQYSGMLETVRIRRQGYPVRFAFQDFVDRFQFLLPPAERKLLAQKGKGGCVDIIKLIGLAPGDCVYGKSKIFFKDKPASFLEARLAQIQAERMQKLMAEIERKKREEQERLEAERRQREEEERRREEEEGKGGSTAQGPMLVEEMLESSESDMTDRRAKRKEERKAQKKASGAVRTFFLSIFFSFSFFFFLTSFCSCRVPRKTTRARRGCHSTLPAGSLSPP